MRYSIRTKIFASFSLLLVVSLSVVTFFWYEKYSRNLTETAEDFLFRSITEENDNFEFTMKDIDYISTIISLNKPNVIDVLEGDPVGSVFDRLQKDRKLDNFISSLYGYKYYISGIQVVGVNGRSYSQGRAVPPDAFRASHWYQTMESLRGNPVFVTTHASGSLDKVSAFDNQNVVSIARSIMDGDKQVGYVMVDFNYEVVRQMFSAPHPNDSRLFLLDSKGNYVYSPSNQDINRNITQTAYDDVWSHLSGTSGRQTVDVNGSSYFVVYYKSDYTNWTTVALVPKSKLLAESRKAANTSMVIPIMTLIAALLIATLLARQITRNIALLRNAMKRVGSGNLTGTIMIRSRDEVEELSRGFNQMVENVKLLIEDVRRTDEQRHVMEFRALQAQINPHFLFNTLNQIRWLADVQKADNINQLVSSLLALLQSSMGKGGEYTTIRDEVQYLKHYLNIQEFRYYDKFEAVFDFDRRIGDAIMLKFILQPIVENALIHGIEPLKGKGMLTVKGYLEGEEVVLQVTDNGVGIPQDQIGGIFELVEAKSRSRFSGIGLSNVQDRVKLHYGPPYGITVSSVQNLFTTVTVRIPYRTNGEE